MSDTGLDQHFHQIKLILCGSVMCPRLLPASLAVSPVCQLAGWWYPCVCLRLLSLVLSAVLYMGLVCTNAGPREMSSFKIFFKQLNESEAMFWWARGKSDHSLGPLYSSFGAQNLWRFR